MRQITAENLVPGMVVMADNPCQSLVVEENIKQFNARRTILCREYLSIYADDARKVVMEDVNPTRYFNVAD
jgi:hypothetical protein